MTSRWTDKVALGCFVAALAAFLGFHAMPVMSQQFSGEWETQMGWTIWEQWWEGVTHLDQLEFEMPGSMAWAAIHALVGMLLASPWLVRALSCHRLLWWLVALMSGATVVGLTGLIGWNLIHDPPDGVDTRLGAGFLVLLLVPPLHFIGVLFVRRRQES